MKLYTRLIESGAFIFWSSDDSNTTFNLKIKIAVGTKKITLVDMNTNVGQNYYSFDRVGSGDYEVELNAISGGAVCQTETKCIKIISSPQKSEENLASLLDKLSEIECSLSEIECRTSTIEDALVSPVKKAQLELDVQRAQSYHERFGEWPNWWDKDEDDGEDEDWDEDDEEDEDENWSLDLDEDD